ncbi:MAG: hypothetical protein JXB45_00680 [Candidatus Krumholzibacteriota bacterium]|nr:hypothetical protein [Candidatus Krumholzibacteriota bacterium]
MRSLSFIPAKKSLFTAAAGALVLFYGAALPAAQPAGESSRLPDWVFRNISPLEISTGGLGSVCLDDPSYLIWKPSLLACTRYTTFAIHHLRREESGRFTSRTDFLGYRKEMMNWGFSVGGLNRTVDNTRPVFGNSRITSQGVFSLALNRRIAGFREGSNFCASLGASASGLWQHFVDSDSTSAGFSLGLNGTFSFYDLVSLGIDGFGLGSQWDKTGFPDSTSIKQEWRNGNFKDPLLHLALYLKVPVPGREYLDKNLSLSWGMLGRRGDLTQFSYGMSYRIAFDKFVPPENTLHPLEIYFNAAYGESSGHGYGIVMNYHGVSFAYSWTPSHSAEHYIGFQIPFSGHTWRQRGEHQNVEQEIRRRYARARDNLRRFTSHKYYSYHLHNDMAGDLEFASSRCSNRSDSVFILKDFLSEIDSTRHYQDRFTGNGLFSDARDMAGVIDSLVTDFTAESPRFTDPEIDLVNALEEVATDIDSFSYYAPEKISNISRLRRFRSHLGKSVERLQFFEGDIREEYSRLFQVSPDSVPGLLKEKNAARDIARLQTLSSLISNLNRERDNIAQYFLFLPDSLEIKEIFPVAYVARETALDIGSVTIQNHHGSHTIKNIQTAFVCGDTVNLWHPEYGLRTELLPGERARVPLKIIPVTDFFSVDTTGLFTSSIRISYMLEDRKYNDRLDSLRIKIHDSRLLPTGGAKLKELLPYFVDPRDRLIKKAGNTALQLLRNTCILHGIEVEPDSMYRDKVRLALASMNFTADNMPSRREEIVPAEGGNIRIARFDEILFRGPQSPQEKAVFTASLLHALEVPCCLAGHRDRWLLLIPRDKLETPYKDELFAELDSVMYIPLEMRLKRDRFFDALSAGKELISAYQAERKSIARFQHLKRSVLSMSKNSLCQNMAQADSCLLLFQKAYQGIAREIDNPYLGLEEEKRIRLKLAFAYVVQNNNAAVKEQFIQLLCLDDTVDWYGKSGLLTPETLALWNEARENYRPRCSRQTAPPIDRSLTIITLPAGRVNIHYRKPYPLYPNFNFSSEDWHGEYIKLKSLRDILELL